MTLRIMYLATAFQFKTKYLTLNIPERRLLIDECIRYLETTEDTASKNWFMIQKSINDVKSISVEHDQNTTDETRGNENTWNEFYAMVATSTHLRLLVETFLEHS